MADKEEVNKEGLANLNMADLFFKALNQVGENMDKDPDSNLNVLVAGGTGVGKSTLINVVFGEEMARTGQGKPVTTRAIRLLLCYNVLHRVGASTLGVEAVRPA
nr:GTPase [Helicobacter salomonis]